MRKVFTFFFLTMMSIGAFAQTCEAYFEAYALQDTPCTFQFVNDSYSQLGQGDSYVWDFGNNDIFTTQDNDPVTYTYEQTGLFYPCVTIYTLDSCVNTFCDSLFVNCGSTGLDCQAEVYTEIDSNYVQFYAMPFNGVAPYTYYWELADGSISTLQNPANYYPNPGTYTATVTITDATGCSNTYALSFIIDNPNGNGNDDCYTVQANLSPYAQNDPIFQQVIAADGFCCETGWDSICQDAYNLILNGGTGGQDSTCYAAFQAETNSSPVGGYNITAYATTDAEEYLWTIDELNTFFEGPQASFNVPEGVFELCLTVTTGNCTDTYCEDIMVGQGNNDPCYIGFEWWASDNDPYTINFYGYTQGDTPIIDWFFEFGNNTIGQTQETNTTYNQDGFYLVTLTTIDANQMTCTFVDTISVNGNDNTDCTADFSYNLSETDTEAQVAVLSANSPNGFDYIWEVYNVTDPNVFEMDTLYGQTATIILNSGVYEICLNIDCTPNGFGAYSCQQVIIDGTNNGICESILNQTSPYGEDDAIFQQVIAQDWYCCDVAWDGICQGQYDELAGNTTGGGNATDSLGCLTIYTGESPYGEDDAIFQQVIAQDSWCCNNGWDALCQSQYNDLAGITVTDSINNDAFICGNVFGGSPNISQEISGTVYLIAFNPQTYTLDAVATQSFGGANTSNEFCFDLSNTDLSQASFLYLKAALGEDSPYYESLLPTYYEDSPLWFNAQPVYPNNEYTIYLVPGNNPGGPGFVEGSIIEGAGKTNSDMANIPVLITHLDRSPVTYTMTDENGNYDFSNLAYGTYQIIPDVLGQRIIPTIITISAATPTIVVDDIEVETDEDNTNLDPTMALTHVAVYPNPTQNACQIKLQSNDNQSATISLYNVLGELVNVQKVSTHTGVNTFTQNMETFANGIYLLEVQMNDGSWYHTKIIKE